MLRDKLIEAMGSLKSVFDEVRLDLVVLDELGYLPFSKNGGQLLFHLISRLYERTSLLLFFGLIRPKFSDYSNLFEIG